MTAAPVLASVDLSVTVALLVLVIRRAVLGV